MVIVSETMRQMMNRSAEKKQLTMLPSGSYSGTKECEECHISFSFETDMPIGFEMPNLCPTCSEKAKANFTPELEDHSQQIAKERQILQQIIKAQINTCLPPKYIDLETDKTDPLEKYYQSSVYVFGNSGTGKSVWAACMVKKHIRARGQAQWISMAEFIMQLQSLFKNPEENVYEAAKNTAAFPGLLIIDDLGSEKLTEYVEQIIYYLLNYREEHCLQTIITGNLSVVEQGKRINQRISSRLSAMKILQFTGQDKRIKR